jgi:hypothetical protein
MRKTIVAASTGYLDTHSCDGTLTFGMASLSACEDAASVVTVLKAGRATGMKALRLIGAARLLLIVRDSIADDDRGR